VNSNLVPISLCSDSYSLRGSLLVINLRIRNNTKIIGESLSETGLCPTRLYVSNSQKERKDERDLVNFITMNNSSRIAIFVNIQFLPFKSLDRFRSSTNAYYPGRIPDTRLSNPRHRLSRRQYSLSLRKWSAGNHRH
jgi:hypothetical protein